MRGRLSIEIEHVQQVNWVLCTNTHCFWADSMICWNNSKYTYFAGAAVLLSLLSSAFRLEQGGFRGGRNRHGNDRGSFEDMGCLGSECSLCWRYGTLNNYRCIFESGVWPNDTREPCRVGLLGSADASI